MLLEKYSYNSGINYPTNPNENLYEYFILDKRITFYKDTTEPYDSEYIFCGYRNDLKFTTRVNVDDLYDDSKNIKKFNIIVDTIYHNDISNCELLHFSSDLSLERQIRLKKILD